MIKHHDVESLGRELRSVGHRRHELAERVFEAVQQGGGEQAQGLYRELTDVTGQAISLMQRQLDTFGAEIQSPGKGRREFAAEHVAASAHLGEYEQAQEVIPQLTDITGQGTDVVPRPRG